MDTFAGVVRIGYVVDVASGLVAADVPQLLPHSYGHLKSILIELMKLARLQIKKPRGSLKWND